MATSIKLAKTNKYTKKRDYKKKLLKGIMMGNSPNNN